GQWQGQHPGRAAESHRPLLAVEHAPARWCDLDCLPPVVCEIYIDATACAADAHVDLTLHAIETSSCLAQQQRRLQRLTVRCGALDLVEDAHQPVLEAARAQRPRLAPSVDLDIGVSHRTGCVISTALS